MNRLTLSLLLFVGLSQTAGCEESKKVERAVLISPTGQRSPQLEVEIADTEGARHLGLMYRREMEKTHGMVFIFEDEVQRGFWMKNTFLELDMLFFDSKGRLVSIVEHAAPLTETRRESTGPAKYVLEILGGEAHEWGIVPGSRISFLTGPLAERFPDSSS